MNTLFVIVGAVILVWGASYLIVWPNDFACGSSLIGRRTVSRQAARPVPDAGASCTIAKSSGLLLTIKCGDGEHVARPALIEPLARSGVSYTDSSAAFAQALDEFAALGASGSKAVCRLFALPPDHTYRGMPLVDCSIGRLSLAQYALLTGRAELTSPELAGAAKPNEERRA